MLAHIPLWDVIVCAGVGFIEPWVVLGQGMFASVAAIGFTATIFVFV